MTEKDPAEDDRDTVDIEQDTEDLTEDSTHPDSDESDTSERKRGVSRIRMPSKDEIVQAVDSVKTETLELDAVSRAQAEATNVDDLE